MKAKALVYLLLACTVVLTAWYLQGPKSAQADEIPEKYRDTVRKGLEYLAKHQHQDGHWEGDDGKHPVAMTGLVGLALLMEGDRRGNKQDRKFAVNVTKAAEWLMEKSKGRNGLIFSDHPSETARYMEGHGLATLFLVGVLEARAARLVPQEKLHPVVEEAINYIVKAQSTQGGWYHTSKAEGHDSDALLPTVIQIQALQAAREVGFPVRAQIINDAQKYLNMKLEKLESTKNGKNGGFAVETTSVLACQLNPLERRRTKDEVFAKRFKQCQTENSVGRKIRFGHDELVHYYHAQVVFSQGEYGFRGGGTFEHDAVWNEYRSALFDQLKSNQKTDGSWPAAEGICHGAVYSTALWCTILQLDSKGHPLLQLPELPVD